MNIEFIEALEEMAKDKGIPREDLYAAIRKGLAAAFAEENGLAEDETIDVTIEGDDIVYHPFVHMGIAIGGKRGLVVPVIRHAEKRSFAELEQSIVDFAKKIDQNKLALSDLEGGTFTISNGGVYGSLLSTPILNMPQSGILGMHKIEKRPVVIEDPIQQLAQVDEDVKRRL